MKVGTTLKVLGLVMVMVFCYAGIVGADSDSAIGSGNSAAVELDFQINIPSFLYFRVGTAGSGNKDTITFSPSPEQIADPLTTGQNISGTGGDAGNGAVNVILVSNGGALTISADGGGGLIDVPSGHTIDFASISTTTSNADLPAPALSNGTSTSSPTPTGNITNLIGVWTYDFDMPAAVPEGGTYAGTVTYSVSVP